VPDARLPRDRPGVERRSLLWIAILVLVFAALSMLRPVDHDESQYVAAAALTASGLLPYRDFAYLQTPLQPFLLAPVAALTGAWTWPALRLVNALLGAVAIVATVWAARTAGAAPRMALIAGALFAGCDILLFSIGTARNDALPAACLAVAIALAMRQECEATRGRAMLIGLLLAAAAAAKISYALPAAAYGTLALVRRERQPGWVALGAVPMVAFVAWTYAIAPAGFVFGTLTFPALAPADWYADRPWKLSGWAKAIDVVKFLSLGAGLPALLLVIRRRGHLLWWLLIAGLVAAVLPTPTWRQYLLPALPPLFVLLALRWTQAPPSRGWHVAIEMLATAGLVPSGIALVHGDAMPQALREAAAIGVAMDRAAVRGPVVSLSPQFVTLAGRLPDARFATGPFVFRGRAIVPPGEAARLVVVPRSGLAAAFTRNPPAAILTGGEGWTSGDPRLDTDLDRWAASNGYRATKAGRFTLWSRAAITRS